MKFTKMHGLGNDYIYIDCMDGSFGGADSSLIYDDDRLAEISRRLSDRHCGIGGDGIIMILPSDNADFKMRISMPTVRKRRCVATALVVWVSMFTTIITRRNAT